MRLRASFCAALLLVTFLFLQPGVVLASQPPSNLVRLPAQRPSDAVTGKTGSELAALADYGPGILAVWNHAGTDRQVYVWGWGWPSGVAMVEKYVPAIDDWSGQSVLVEPDGTFSVGYWSGWPSYRFRAWKYIGAEKFTKVLDVAELHVTSIDNATDTISGIDAPGSEIEVYAWSEDGRKDPVRVVTTDASGVWTADFNTAAVPGTGDPDWDRAWDIGPSSEGAAYHFDDDDDATVDRWAVPSSPPRQVYRFRNLQNGTYLWSADPSERVYINAHLSATWLEEGRAYSINPDKNKSTLMRFRNIRGGFYLYSSDPAEWAYINANLSREWVQEGRAYGVTRSPNEYCQVVWRFRNLWDGTYLYSADPDERDVINEQLSDTWVEEGEAYYLRQ